MKHKNISRETFYAYQKKHSILDVIMYSKTSNWPITCMLALKMASKDKLREAYKVKRRRSRYLVARDGLAKLSRALNRDLTVFM